MRYLILTVVTVLLLAGCSVEQRSNCAFCRFISGDWNPRTQPWDSNAPSLFDPNSGFVSPEGRR